MNLERLPFGILERSPVIEAELLQQRRGPTHDAVHAWAHHDPAWYAIGQYDARNELRRPELRAYR